MEGITCFQNFRQEDLETFNCLVLACQNLVFQHAVWMLGEVEAAEMIAQGTLLMAHRRLHSFRGGDFRMHLMFVDWRKLFSLLGELNRKGTRSIIITSIDCFIARSICAPFTPFDHFALLP